ncbi:MAG: hypothetical protein ACJA0Z_002254, partial [Halioglobus sp.]
MSQTANTDSAKTPILLSTLNDNGVLTLT